ncbi:MAG: helix-turn-helix transcriptional regulator [Gordonibacter sp.]|nr:helix-turn-helix transcriptional regulator [Gordonibacter sp.]
MKEMQSILKSQGVFPILGLSLPLAWIYGPFLSGELFYICFHSSFGCTLLALALWYSRRPQSSPAFARAPWIAAALMCFAPLSVFLFSGGPEVVLVACGILSGAGGAYCFCQWFYMFCALPVKRAVNYTLLAFSFSSCIRFVLVLLSGVLDPVAGIALMAIPFLSGLALQKTRAMPEIKGYAPASSTPSAEAKGKHLSGFLIIVAEIVVYGLVFGLLRNGISEWSNSTSSMIMGHLLRIVLPLLLFFWLAARAQSKRSDGLLRALLLAIVFTLLAALFFGGVAESVLSAIVLAMRSFVSILIYLLLLEATHRMRLHPCFVYGIGRAVYELSLVAGLLVYDQAMVTGFFEALPFNVVYFAVSCVLLLLLNSFSRTTRLPFVQPPLPFAASSIDDQCDQVGEQYCLTEREVEIMKLIGKGRSKKYIAGTLYLSEDTIRWHTKQLYRKLDIHNRQELLTKIGIE